MNRSRRWYARKYHRYSYSGCPRAANSDRGRRRRTPRRAVAVVFALDCNFADIAPAHHCQHRNKSPPRPAATTHPAPSATAPPGARDKTSDSTTSGGGGVERENCRAAQELNAARAAPPPRSNQSRKLHDGGSGPQRPPNHHSPGFISGECHDDDEMELQL